MAVVTAMGEGAGLPEHGVDQGRLAVVDVSDDGDVAKIRARIHVRDCRSAGIHSRKRRKAEDCEVQQVRRNQTEEEVLPQQAPVQTLSRGPSQGTQGRATGLRGKELEKVFKRTQKVMTTSQNIGVP